MTSSSKFNFSTNPIPIFAGESYDYWNIQMKTRIISQDFWEITEEGFVPAQNLKEIATRTQEKQKGYKENKRKDAKQCTLFSRG